MITPEKQVAATETQEMSAEEMQALAYQHFAEDEPAEPVVEPVKAEAKPRDEQGRFTPVAADTSCRREIDLGDGSGKQVFEAKTADELLDKMATAQLNATKKIREQATRLREFEESHSKVDEASKQQKEADADFALSQELLTRPTAAIKAAFKQMTGYDVDEFATVTSRMKAFQAAESARQEESSKEQASNAFITEHADYVPTPRNGKLLVRAIEQLKQGYIQRGEKFEYQTLLTEAFQDLNSDGLLDIESPQDPAKQLTAANHRIDGPGDEVAHVQSPPQARRTSSSLSSRASAGQSSTRSMTDDEITKLPADKLRQLAYAAFTD